MSPGVAVIVGAGPGTGAAVAKAFAKKGFSVALLARTKTSLDTIADSINQAGGVAKGFSCDIGGSPEDFSTLFRTIKSEFNAPIKVGIFNVGGFVMKPFLKQTIDDIASSQKYIQGAFLFSQEVISSFLEAKTEGTLLFSGATAALRGSQNFSTFAAQKFAVRGLSQSLAREFQPQGIHVAHVIIDGIINTDRVAGMMGAAEKDTRLSPDAIAQAFVYLHEQPKSAWTHELDLRPFSEKF
ncbi:hypothetical protein HDU97_006419 [Phlyctochytrium planicorne]|nr:hypothetical protein HDU97_006419 [Phlyctochytrium planicorne]